MAVKLVRSARQKDEDVTERLARAKPGITQKKVEPEKRTTKKSKPVIGKSKNIDIPDGAERRGRGGSE